MQPPYIISESKRYTYYTKRMKNITINISQLFLSFCIFHLIERRKGKKLANYNNKTSKAGSNSVTTVRRLPVTDTWERITGTFKTQIKAGIFQDRPRCMLIG